MTLYALVAGRLDADQSLFDDNDTAIAKRPAPRSLLAGGRVVSGLLAATAIAAILSLPLRGENPGNAAPAAFSAEPIKAPWIDIRKPLQIYSLPIAEFAKAAASYEARRRAAGDARVDTLTFGGFGGEASWLRVSVQRSSGAEASAPPGFFVEVARRAAEAGLALTRSSLPSQFPSRFGLVEVAEINLDKGADPVACLGFRLADLGPSLRIAGMACGGKSKAMAPGALVCMLERLTLNSAGDDVALRDFFTLAELKRDRFCNGIKYVGR